jgi:hypothetical protein
MSFKGKNLSLDAAVDFVEIIKVDKANRKINFTTTTRIKKLIQATEGWQQSCKNTPDFKLSAQVKKKINRMCKPWAISPLQVMSLSQRKYIRDGGDFTSVPGISFADAMKLFLEKQRIGWINESLCHVSAQYQPLLKYCALSKLQELLPRKSITVKTSPRYNAQALSAVTLIAVLLFKKGRTKEDYMQDFAFQLGQLCSAMDEVHIGYCVSERSGKIPNILLGNQVYGMALQAPLKAMAFMASRRRPYDSWAKRKRIISVQEKQPNDKGKKTLTKAETNALYAHSWMSKQAETLNQHLQGNDTTSSDSYKAELMLGYLAGRPFKQKNDSKETNKEKGENK